MKGLFLGSLAIGLCVGICGSGRLAVAENGQFSPAGACQWDNSDDIRPVNEGWVDNYDNDGDEHRVHCGLTDQGDQSASTTDDLLIYFDDNNNDTGMEDTIYCSAESCDIDGDVCYNETTKFGNASGGTTSPANYDGLGYISFSNVDRPLFGYHEVSCHLPNPDFGNTRLFAIYLIS